MEQLRRPGRHLLPQGEGGARRAADLSSFHDQANIAEDCSKSCGLCPGLTPAPSNTCYDTFSTLIADCSHNANIL